MFQTTKQKSTETGWIRYISYITQNVNVTGLNPLIPATPPDRPPFFSSSNRSVTTRVLVYPVIRITLYQTPPFIEWSIT